MLRSVLGQTQAFFKVPYMHQIAKGEKYVIIYIYLNINVLFIFKSYYKPQLSFMVFSPLSDGQSVSSDLARRHPSTCSEVCGAPICWIHSLT